MMAFNNPSQSSSNIKNINTSVTEKKSMSNSANSTFGGRGNAWSLSSIWSGGITNGLTSSANTRDNSVSRDTLQTTLGPPAEEIEGKTGSGSLVDSSVSEDFANRSSLWAAKRNTAGSLSGPSARYPDGSIVQSRSASNVGLPQSHPAGNQNSMPFTTRATTVHLNPTASNQARHTFGSAFTSVLPGRPSDQPPPNVYTKFDRPIDPSQRKPDSAIGSWADAATTPSPSDERRPILPMQYNRTPSMPTSRDGSLPPSRHTDEAPSFTRPDYTRPAQRATPNSSRAPSISSSRNGVYSGYFSANPDQKANQIGQLHLNGDSRPSTSYQQSQGRNGYNSVSPPSTGRHSLQTSGFETNGQHDAEGTNLASLTHVGHDGYVPLQQNATGPTSHTDPTFVERFLQSGNAYEFRPGQPYTGNGISTRPYDLSGTVRSSDWQNLANGHMVMSRRSPSVQDQQMYLDPRFQNLMAAQLRSQYAAMYGPFGIPPTLQVSAVPPYMAMLPLGVPAIETSTELQNSPVGDGMQSALMYEFKSNPKSKRYELSDIYDHIAEFSGDQHGSRFIQTKLETANSDEKERVFREIQPNAIPLMTDVFGNYVIQKFFEHGDQTHKKILANKMRGQVLQLSLQMYGCRVVQKALDHVLVDQQALLISELENHVLRCVKDQNGNHVIQKAIERCSPSTIGFIIAAFHGQVQHLSIHPYGCRVIQRCLEKCDLPSKSMIMSELMEGIPAMISDQYGNYVVQHIVSHDDGEAKQLVLRIVSHGVGGYSKHKFASNVVEKCLEKADDAWRRKVVIALASSNQRLGGETTLVGMIKDSFGNYVIQKLLDTLSLDDYFLFLDLLQPAMTIAKRGGCGKQTLSIEKKMHRYDAYRNGSATSAATFSRPTVQLPVPTPPFASNYNSAATTPPPLTADTQSLQSSGISSVDGDAVEGAAFSRKCSE